MNSTRMEDATKDRWYESKHNLQEAHALKFEPFLLLVKIADAALELLDTHVIATRESEMTISSRNLFGMVNP